MIDPLTQHLAEQERHRENRGRLAFSSARAQSKGAGVFEFEERHDFGTVFVERPIVSYGAELDIDEIRRGLGVGDDALFELPQSTGYVVDWDRTEKGHYAGAWVAVSVRYPDDYTTAELMIQIFHSWMFAAIGIKEL